MVFKCSIFNRYHENDEEIIYNIKSNNAFYSDNMMGQSNTRFSRQVEVFYIFFVGSNGEMKLEKKSRKLKSNELFASEIESWMIPTVNMIVLAHSYYGEFIFDALKLKIDAKSKLWMTIDIESNKNEKVVFKPNDKIEVKLKVKNVHDLQSTCIHVLSVDERVKYIGVENDISKERLEKLIDKRCEKENSSPVKWSGVKPNSQYDDLSKFNAFIMTNAYIDVKDCEIVTKSDGIVINEDIEKLEVGSDRAQLIKTSLLRTAFPETFMFEDIAGSKLNFLVNAYIFIFN